MCVDADAEKARIGGRGNVKILRQAILGSVGAGALMGGSAVAQTVPAPGQDPAQDASAPQAGDETTIVVTAQRRSQRLVDAPVSVTAFDAETIETAGITNLLDVTKITPGVVININGAYLQPTIRGIGTNIPGPGADPNVAIYVDNIYQSSQTGNIFELANVENIQVLKGAQGTLFGRNATGGAILIKLKDPSYTTSGKFNLSYGRFNEVLASGYVTTGLTDNVAADVSAYFRRSDGWIKDLNTGDDRNRQKSFDIRSKLLVDATDDLRFIAALGYSYTSDPTGLANVSINGNTSGRLRPGGLPIATGPRVLSANQIPTNRVKAITASLTATLDTGIGTISSISAYRNEKAFVKADLDSSYALVQQTELDQKFDDFTQEINLVSNPGSDLSYVIGAFYFHEKSGFPRILFNNNPFFRGYITTNAISGYADFTYKIGNISLIAGARLSSETKHFQYSPGAVPGYAVDTESTFTNFSPRAGISYAITEDSNIYATFSKGFKSGTYNITSSDPNPVKPEKVDAYELGYKIGRGGLNFTIAGYYYNYDNIQINALDFNTSITRLINAAKAEIYGVDGDISFEISDNLRVRAAAAYAHARFTSFPGAVTFQPIGGNSGNTTVIIDAAGSPLIRAPEFTLSGTVDYSIPVGRNELNFSLTPYWTSKINYSFNERIQQPGYVTLDANISYEVDNWRFSIYGRNLTDKVYATFRSETASRDSITYAKPRTFGVAASYKF
jgi:iron complex outermembrane receptor protein